jgi:hypothetical protein
LARSLLKLEAEHWRARAQQIGGLAKNSVDPEARADILRLVTDCVAMAVRAEAMERWARASEVPDPE